MKYKARAWVVSNDDRSKYEKVVYGTADSIEEAKDILRNQASGDDLKLYVVDAWGKIKCDLTKELLGE